MVAILVCGVGGPGALRILFVRPERIILMRHGESEANENPAILADKPDNAINTDKGAGV
jgi:hypothetical protein